MLTLCRCGVGRWFDKGGSTRGGPNLVIKCRSTDVYLVSKQCKIIVIQRFKNSYNFKVFQELTQTKSQAILDKSNMYHFLDVIILMTEINHAYLRIMLPKEWFLNIYFILDMVTDKGKCLVWSLHGWFGIIVLKCGLISSAFGLRRWTLAPKGFFNSSRCCDGWHMEAGWGSPHVRSGKQICKGHSCTLTPLMRCTAHM